tara:strand:+ start:3207 stop:4043 length:837 start_codon:yes stop_codon:yes gene_type:complete
MKKLVLLFFAAFLLLINSCTNLDDTINVMTFNIRLDTENDGINKWDNRKEGIISLIKKNQVDILGIQEGLPNQIEYLSRELNNYSMIGEGRNGGNNGEFSAIFYNNNKLRLQLSQTLWLSETPNTPSIGWDAALNRIVTMGVFTLKNSIKKLIVYNTHFDHIGELARENSIGVILNHIKTNKFLKDKLIVMGDFNAIPEEKPIKLINKVFSDSFDETIDKPHGTYSGFELDSRLEKRIDYIFIKNIEIIDYKHIRTKLQNNHWPSDHIPIMISINKNL